MIIGVSSLYLNWLLAYRFLQFELFNLPVASSLFGASNILFNSDTLLLYDVQLFCIVYVDEDMKFEIKLDLSF